MKNELARLAIRHTLFAPTTLAAAISRLGFVQADPIRAPARAQDLILRHRVDGYRAGDLERHYPALELDEDLLYAYGFVPRAHLPLLHPRRKSRVGKLEERIFARFSGDATVHAGQLDAEFGRKRVMNAWGGYSRATKRALEQLHHAGLLRIARRENGIRIYSLSSEAARAPLSPGERTRRLIALVVQVLAPVSERTLHAILAQLRRRVAEVLPSRPLVDELLRSGELTPLDRDGVRYLHAAPPLDDEVPRRVRFLAPFDPLVWDRARFEHFWGWAYRFEAYTPAAKRLRGYYAMPLLWGESMIGWANALQSNGELKVSLGFVAKPPREPRFRSELEREVDRLRAFL